MEKENTPDAQGLAGSTPAPAVTPHVLGDKELRDLINQSAIEGMLGACSRFLHARNVTHSIPQLMDFVSKMTAEYSTDPREAASPLPESISYMVGTALTQADDTIKALNQNGEMDNIVKLVRVIAGGELLHLMDTYAGESIEIFNSK